MTKTSKTVQLREAIQGYFTKTEVHKCYSYSTTELLSKIETKKYAVPNYLKRVFYMEIWFPICNEFIVMHRVDSNGL